MSNFVLLPIEICLDLRIGKLDQKCCSSTLKLNNFKVVRFIWSERDFEKINFEPISSIHQMTFLNWISIILIRTPIDTLPPCFDFFATSICQPATFGSAKNFQSKSFLDTLNRFKMLRTLVLKRQSMSNPIVQNSLIRFL